MKKDCANEHDIAQKLLHCVEQESNNLAHFIELLATLDRNRGYARLGYSSLFDFCTKHLHLTNGETATRVRLAKVFQREARVLEVLKSGAVGMCALRILSPILTVENFDSVIDAAQGKSARDLEYLKASLQHGDHFSHSHPNSIRAFSAPPNPATPNAPEQKLVRVSITMNEDVWIKYERACALANQNTNANNLSAMFEKMVDVFLEKQLKQRGIKSSTALNNKPTVLDTKPSELNNKSNAQTQEPEPPTTNPGSKKSPECVQQISASKFDTCSVSNPPSPNHKMGFTPHSEHRNSRYIPRAVAAEVWQRDEGRCTYTAPLSGQRCECKRGLQIDHKIPFARGGSSSQPENLRLLCPQHNRLAADDIFGTEFMLAAELRPRKREGHKKKSDGFRLSPIF